jgi:ABC-type sulfate transport system substrate-binding protein
MTVTATPATIAPRMGMIGGVLRGAGARLHTDEDMPSEFQREVMNARAGEAAAQTLANTALLDLAITQAEVREVRQLLLDTQVEADAMRAQLTAERPVIEMAGLVAHGHRGVADVRQAYTTYVEEGPR